MAVSASIAEGRRLKGAKEITFTLSGTDTGTLASHTEDTPGWLMGCFVDATTGTAPDANWDFTIEDDDNAGVDLMAGGGTDMAAAEAEWHGLATPAPVSGKLGITVASFGASTSRDAVVKAVILESPPAGAV